MQVNVVDEFEEDEGFELDDEPEGEEGEEEDGEEEGGGEEGEGEDVHAGK